MESRDVYVYMQLGGDWAPAGLLRLALEGATVASATFRYGRRYLQRQDAVPVDVSALPLRDAAFQTDPKFDIFTGIKDALPDSWGRAVMERRAGRVLREDEFLLASPDTRVGGLAFGTTLEGPQRVTPWASNLEVLDIADLESIQKAYVTYTEGDIEALDEAMRRFVLPGSSLGGARPKASVVLDGKLWIAKFDRSSDAFDYTRAELATMRLAQLCGINTPATAHREIAGRGTFLVERFDRQGENRAHFNSMLSVLRETEMSFFHSSYMDISDALLKYTRDYETTRVALFRRMVFNGLCANDDDHLRNHGLLWSNDSASFELSPAYDLVPNPAAPVDLRLAIGCGVDDNGAVTRNFSEAASIRSAASFGLSAEDAQAIFDDVKAQLKDWAQTFEDTGIKPASVRMFANAFRRV